VLPGSRTPKNFNVRKNSAPKGKNDRVGIPAARYFEEAVNRDQITGSENIEQSAKLS
jgi:hypothetical protein